MSDSGLTFEQQFDLYRCSVEDYLSQQVLVSGGVDGAETLERALGHALAGGKRIRPVLVVATCEAVGGTVVRALPTAAAVELFHAYSLVHDDLPAMDDDAVRRGQPSVHARFDEATAILVGDALLTLGFECIALRQAQLSPPSHTLAVLGVLARALGMHGMVRGQYLDLKHTFQSADQLQAMQDLKTGALLSAACQVGALLGGAPADIVAAVSRFGLLLGQTYQLVDDLLDREQDQRGSMLDFLSEEELRARADQLSASACAQLEPLGQRGTWLVSLAKNLLFRKN